jgi:hypothetical protein
MQGRKNFEKANQTILEGSSKEVHHEVDLIVVVTPLALAEVPTFRSGGVWEY